MNEMNPSADLPVLTGAVVQAILGAGRTVEARLEAALSPLGLSAAQYEVLRALHLEDEPLMLSALAAHARCVRSNMTALVDRLERDGHVRRIPNPDDRRSIRVQLTPQGAGAYEAAVRALEAVEVDLLGRLTPGEQGVCRRVFERLTSGV